MSCNRGIEMLCNIFDSHAHYDDEAFSQDRDELLNELFSSTVCNVINVGADVKSSEESIKLANKYSQIYASVGAHPHCVSDLPENYIEIFSDLAKNEKVVAIGEIGLDYHYDTTPKDMQKKYFEKQLILAQNLDLPVIIHTREATEDTLKVLKKYKVKGTIHCFSESIETLKEVLKMGMYISLGGAVTFKNARKLLEVAYEVPIERLLLETDAPYMTPVPFRGKRCDSSMIKYTAEKIAEIKGISVEFLLEQARTNAESLFLSNF